MNGCRNSTTSKILNQIGPALMKRIMTSIMTTNSISIKRSTGEIMTINACIVDIPRLFFSPLKRQSIENNCFKLSPKTGMTRKILLTREEFTIWLSTSLRFLSSDGVSKIRIKSLITCFHNFIKIHAIIGKKIASTTINIKKHF